MTNFLDQSNFWEFFCHHCHKLFVAYFSISILVSVVDHLVNLCCWKCLSNACCDLFELFRSKCTSSLWIKHFEQLVERGLWISVSAKSEDFKEGGKIILVGIGMGVNDGQNLLGLLIKSKGTNGVNELFGWDITAVVIVEDVEAVFHSLDIIFFKVLVGIFTGVKGLSYWKPTLLIVDMDVK